MANDEHLKILRMGAQAWNEWRFKSKRSRTRVYDFTDANLSGITLRDAYLQFANFSGADLSGSDFRGANFRSADFSGANLREANLRFTILIAADFSNANLSGSYLSGAHFFEANLEGADFSNAKLERTNFSSNDLSMAKGLESVVHYGPSAIGIDTLYKSGGNIPVSFLRNCGVPDNFIDYLPSLVGAQQAIQFYSCFISYSHKDEEFAKRLHSRLRDEHLRVWFAPEDIKGGEKLKEQIDRALQVHDRLLIVLSESSLNSEWVMTEIREARKVEIRERRQKLFPIRLVNFEDLQEWRCFDADNGKDLAVEVREYFIPDFSNWRNHDAFEAAFAKLLKDLRAAEKVGSSGTQTQI